MNYEYLGIAGALFLWLLTTWDAFSRLSGGRIRRLESEDRELARYLETLKDDEQDYNVVFRMLLFALLGFITALLFNLIRDLCPEHSIVQRAGEVALIIFILTIICGIITRLLVWKLDIPIIRFTFPLLMLLKQTVLWPVVFMMRLISRKVEGIGINEENQEKVTVEDEIMSLVDDDDDDGDAGDLEEDEKRMIRGIFDLDDTLVREIMTPRVDMHALSGSSTITEAREEFIASGHSRIPVYGENIDEIKGVVYAKDFLDDACRDKTLEQMSHTPVFIPETKNVGDLLEEFKVNRIHFAVIIDEYGGTSGVVSLEDILEEIVGEICDEYDSDTDDETKPQFMPDGTVVIDARTMIDDVNELFDIDLTEDEDVDTIAGYVCAEFGKIPESGEEIVLDDKLHVTILEADKRKIISLNLKLLSKNDKK
jgi:magnesium and cobalt exporter, CNNM family